MKAYYASGTLHLYLDKPSSEHILFGRTYSRLEAPLQDHATGDDLGKKVILAYNEQQVKRAIVSWQPEGDDVSWDDVSEIHVNLSPSAQIDFFVKGKLRERYSTGTIFIDAENTAELK